MMRHILLVVGGAASSAPSKELAEWRLNLAVLLNFLAALTGLAFVIAVMRADSAAVKAGKSPPRRLKRSDYALLLSWGCFSIAAVTIVGRNHVAEYAGWSFLFGLLDAPLIIFGVIRWLRYRV